VKRSASILVLSLFLSVVLVSFSQIGVVKAEDTIYIRADGTVEGTDKIHRNGNVYTLTDNIDVYKGSVPFGAGIKVERDDVVIDGCGYSIQAQEYVYSGIDLAGRSNVTIKNMQIRDFNHGFFLDESSGNTISGNDISGASDNGYPVGFWVWNSSNNNIIGNKITDHSEYGILFHFSNSNIVSGNNITNNNCGIYFESSPNNMLRNNRLNENNETIHVASNALSDVVQDIDASNTVNGKPVYYWINQHSKVIPADAGFVGIINCTNITAQNLNLTNNPECILLVSTTDSMITNNNIENSGTGISIKNSQNVTVIENHVTGISVAGSNSITIIRNNVANSGGISLTNSKDVNVSGNNITANSNGGIKLLYSNGNTVSYNYIADNQYAGIDIVGHNNCFCSENRFIGNTLIENNGWGIRLSGAENNTFYHNNFIGNKVSEGIQVSNPWFWGRSETNVWDNGFEGNYWSDYVTRYPNASEIDGSGIGDTPSVINEGNVDIYPLMVPIEFFDAGTWEWTSYSVDVISNSTVSDFSFNPDEGALIRFDVEGEEGTTGFCRVTIPKDFLDTEGNWNVLVDGASVTPTVNEDGSNTYLYFTYNHNTKTVEIIGTTAIPEFPSCIVLPFLFAATLMVILYKKRLPKNLSNQQKSFILGD
jgi:parallel beta-helix repeat protein